MAIAKSDAAIAKTDTVYSNSGMVIDKTDIAMAMNKAIDQQKMYSNAVNTFTGLS